MPERSIWLTGRSPAPRADHAPAADGPALDRLEHEALEAETEETDDEEGAHHDVGVEVFLGVEDHEPEAPGRRRDHLAADHGDPSAREGLAKARDDEGQGARQHDLEKERARVGAHRLGGAEPQPVDRADTGPGVQDQREDGGIDHEPDGGGIAEPEPENEQRHPGERGDRAEHAHQRKEEPLDGSEAAHQHAERHADETGAHEPDEDPPEGGEDVHRQRPAGDHAGERAEDVDDGRRQRRREKSAPCERLPDPRGQRGPDQRSGDWPARRAPHRASIPQRSMVRRSMGSNTSFSRPRPTRPMTAIPASITSVARNSRAPKISQPSPTVTEVSISTAMSTRQARATPSRSPVSTYGRAPGSTTLRKSWRSPAPIPCAARIQISFTALTPVHVFTATGNAAAKPTSRTAGRSPSPNHMTKSGA